MNNFNEKEFIDGIILDIDGTIWNTTEIVAQAWNKAIENLKYDEKKLSADDLKKEFGKPMNLIADSLWPDLSTEEKKQLLDECCKEEHIFIQKNNSNICYPTVIETIKKLSVKYNFYIVSNCQDGYIELLLEKTNLSKFIKDYECYGRTKKTKAENITILRNRNRLTNPVYIGDTQGDLDSCLQSKTKFIWAAYGFGKVNSNFQKIEKFSDLENLLNDE